MSQNVLLVEYQFDSEDNIYESGCHTIDVAFIKGDLLEKINNKYPMKEISIYEEAGSSEVSIIDCFDECLIEDTIKLLENEFITLLTTESKDLNKSSNGAEIITKSDLSELINKFRMITNLIYIFRLKNDKYRDTSSVVIKLG